MSNLNGYIERTVNYDKKHVINDDVQLDESIEALKSRLMNDRRQIERGDWESGYTQALIDVFNLLNGTEVWEIS